MDPEFRRRAHAGDILVAGRNFGTGSSREQAVVALSRDLDRAAARRRGCGHSRLWRADGAHASDSRGPIRITTRGKKWLTPG
ncbi:MAG: hypothetical protein WA268_04320 [Xanthobacteraceae bacterium]